MLLVLLVDILSLTSKENRNAKVTDNTPEEQFFRISEQEFEVISSNQDSSTILLGRSGTGKTTCALTNMWATYIAYWKACRSVKAPGEEGNKEGEYSHLHQVFVTANTLLRSEVEVTFRRMMRANIPEHKRAVLLKEENDPEGSLPAHFLDEIPIYEYPLFLSSRQWIIMIDGSLRNPFFSRTGPNKELDRCI